MSDDKTSVTHYAIHSTVRDVRFRAHRAALAAHQRKKHYLGDTQMRLVPGRRLVVTEEVLLRNIDMFRKKAAEHALEVRTMDGRIVDLQTMTPGPLAPTPLLPHPKLDSVADDKQIGQYIPPYVGDDMSMPNVLPPGEKPALLTQATRDLELDQEAEEVPSTPADADPEVDAALAQAAEEDPSPPMAADDVSSEATHRKGKRSRR